MFKPPVNQFNLKICSPADGTRPVATWGTLVTPGNNTYGSYASIIAGASVTADVYGILINFNSWNVSGSAKDSIVTIGLDPAGGSSFTDYINHLLTGPANAYTATDGTEYYFPIYIKAGTSIGAKASTNNATVGTGRVAITLFCRPSRPDLIRVGSSVRSFGADTANSRGVLVTQGTVSEGAWTVLSASTLGDVETNPAVNNTQLPWYWEFGVGCNNATMTAAKVHCDIGIGDGTNNVVAVSNGMVLAAASESQDKRAAIQSHYRSTTLDSVFGRAQSSAAADANFSMMAYGVIG